MSDSTSVRRQSPRGGSGPADRRGGRAPRAVQRQGGGEAPLPDEASADQVDRSVHRELRTLSKDNAEGVARHLAAVAIFLGQEDFESALAHASSATRRAGRVAIVRETQGLVHYRRGEWSQALAEFRTARRLSGSAHLLPLMADCERGLGRPERALELAASDAAQELAAEDRVELALVVSGARRDLGQPRAAVESLRDLVRRTEDDQPWAARVLYAYADALSESGSDGVAAQFLARAAELDSAGLTDAGARVGELEVEDVIDLEEAVDQEAQPGAGSPDRSPR